MDGQFPPLGGKVVPSYWCHPFRRGADTQSDIWLPIYVSNGYTSAMATKNAGLRIRVERVHRDKFREACHAADKRAAQVIRESMHENVATHQTEEQGSLFAAEPLERNL